MASATALLLLSLGAIQERTHDESTQTDSHKARAGFFLSSFQRHEKTRILLETQRQHAFTA
jgi:hypothetical protein